MKRARAEAGAEPSAKGVGAEGSGKKPKKLDAKNGEIAMFKGYSLEGIPREAYPQGDRPNKGAHGYTLRATNGAVTSKHVMSNNRSASSFLVGFPNQSPMNRSKWKPLFGSITSASSRRYVYDR